MHYASLIWVDSTRQMLKHGGVWEGGGISKDQQDCKAQTDQINLGSVK